MAQAVDLTEKHVDAAPELSAASSSQWSEGCLQPLDFLAADMEAFDWDIGGLRKGDRGKSRAVDS